MSSKVDVIVNGPKGQPLRRRVKAPVTGRSNAERWARSLEQELLTQLLSPEPEPEIERPALPTFEELARLFIDLCRANRRAENTVVNYDVHLRHYLLPVLGKRRLDQIKPADITAIKASLAKKAHNTMCEVLKTLRRVLNAAIEEGILEKEPVKVTIPARQYKVPIAYDDNDQAALLAAAVTLGPAYIVFVLLGMDAGLRRGEILGLKWSDLDLARKAMVGTTSRGASSGRRRAAPRRRSASRRASSTPSPAPATNAAPSCSRPTRAGTTRSTTPSAGCVSSSPAPVSRGTAPTCCGRLAAAASPTVAEAWQRSPPTSVIRACRPPAGTSTGVARAPVR